MLTSSSPDIARRTARSQRTPPLTIVAVGLIAMMVLLIAAQFVPYGRNHSNPPVLAEPAWKSAQTRTLFFRACGDCHSNQMVARIGSIALLTMLVSKHRKQGR
jgi:heme-binding protein